MYSVLVFLLRYGLAHYRRKSLHRPPDRRLWMQPSPASPPASSVIPSRNSPTVTENPEIGALGRVVILHATI